MGLGRVWGWPSPPGGSLAARLAPATILSLRETGTPRDGPHFLLETLVGAASMMAGPEQAGRLDLPPACPEKSGFTQGKH